MDSFISLEARTRGDYIIIPAVFTYTGEGWAFDWTDVNARCHIKKSPNATGQICKFSTTGDGTYGSEMKITPSGSGVVIITMVASGTITPTWPVGTLYGDIEVFRESPSWGPYTPAKFTLPMILDITN